MAASLSAGGDLLHGDALEAKGRRASAIKHTVFNALNMLILLLGSLRKTELLVIASISAKSRGY